MNLVVLHLTIEILAQRDDLSTYILTATQWLSKHKGYLDRVSEQLKKHSDRARRTDTEEDQGHTSSDSAKI